MDGVKIGVIGAGSRGTHMARTLCSLDKRVEVKAVYDPEAKFMEDFKKSTGQSGAKCCASEAELLADPEISWVMVMSPNWKHKEQVVASFKAGKNVFAEKPLATTIEDCQAIYDACKESGKLFATGFVLRYAPLYRKLRELLDSGAYGKIVSIDANENITPSHGGYIMRNWRRFSKFAGPHILEKCCHDIDLLNWFVGSLPSKVASFGGNDYFTPENVSIRRKLKDPGKGKESIFGSWDDRHPVDCPFLAEKDVVDNQVSIIEYRNKVRVMFQCTTFNAIPERRMYMTCTEGCLIAELYTGVVRAKRIGKDEPELRFDITGEGHAGGDQVIMKELLDSMLTGSAPKCGGDEGLESAVAALAIDEARLKGSTLDLEPIWRRLGR